MSSQDVIDRACAALAGGRLPDAEGRRLVVLAVRAFLDRPLQTTDSLPPREAKVARDQHLIELSRQHCDDLHEIRPKVRRILTWACRYQATGWRHDQHATVCPAHRIGTPQGLIWAALKAWPSMPGDRLLHDILSTSNH